MQTNHTTSFTEPHPLRLDDSERRMLFWDEGIIERDDEDRIVRIRSDAEAAYEAIVSAGSVLLRFRESLPPAAYRSAPGRFKHRLDLYGYCHSLGLAVVRVRASKGPSADEIGPTRYLLCDVTGAAIELHAGKIRGACRSRGYRGDPRRPLVVALADCLGISEEAATSMTRERMPVRLERHVPAVAEAQEGRISAP